MILGLLLAPMLAGIIGMVIGLEMEDTKKSALITSGIGTFAGYMVYLILTLMFTAIIADGSSSIGEGLVAFAGFGIGVGVAGAGTAALTKELFDSSV